MSWQAYVDDNLIASGMVTAAGIYDLDGNPWAYSSGFAAQVAEVALVSRCMAGEASGAANDASGRPANLAGLAAWRPVVAGISYTYIQGDPGEVYSKTGQTGVVFCRCSTCIIVGLHDDKVQPGQCRTTVGKLADFLKDAGL
jgi:profilin